MTTKNEMPLGENGVYETMPDYILAQNNGWYFRPEADLDDETTEDGKKLYKYARVKPIPDDVMLSIRILQCSDNPAIQTLIRYIEEQK